MTEDHRQQRRAAADDFIQSLDQLESVFQDEAEKAKEQRRSMASRRPSPKSPKSPSPQEPSATSRSPYSATTPTSGQASGSPASFSEALEEAAADIEAFMQSQEDLG